ncbi:MAG: cytidine deaminase [Paludibacteraceae bacterium]
MNLKKIEINVCEYSFSELDKDLQQLITTAKDNTKKSYSPYSKFAVGAALLLENGQIISGSNQENAAYPSGLCAERTAVFYANAMYPSVAPKALAIAAFYNGAFVEEPISPCGSCRQVLLETETRYKTDIQILLYGENRIYLIPSVKQLLPLAFNEQNLKKE